MRRIPSAIALVLSAGCASISPQQEVQMGAEYAQQINAQLPIVRDAQVNQYINALGDQIARVADDRGIDFKFYVVNSPDVNAFAVPGGHVYINRGLIERAQTMAQVAGVLGHEIAHVTERHSVEQMEKQQGAQLGLTLGCVLAPSICNNQAGATAINLGANAAFARFSRKDESEADTRGVEFVTRAGIDPRGVPQMFRILLDERQRNPSRLEAWFATHPLEEDRIQRTQSQIAGLRAAVLQSLQRDSQSFQSFKARVRSLPAATQASR